MYYNATLIVLILILIFLLGYKKLWITDSSKKPEKSEVPGTSQNTEESGESKNLTSSSESKNPEPAEESKNKEIIPGLTTGQDRLPDEDSDLGGDVSNPYYDKYLEIPRKTGCSDEYSKCAEWAANGECEASPDFMIQNCPNSCKSCNLNQEQKGVLVQYYMSEPLKKCIYRGEPYPPGLRLSVFVSDLYR